MLSLLSLLLASGTVLRADTEEWTPITYPDPRKNFTLCNTWENSTLCDPDHILTDQWRAEINRNINRQVEKLKYANILYTDNAPTECYDNTTDSGVKIYVILAKRIQNSSNQSITSAELIDFGDKLAEAYGLNKQICQNYLLLIGVETAKNTYTRTGSHLKLPEDLMVRIYNQSENVFKEKNYMEGLNKMIDELGDEMMDPFKYKTTTEAAVDETTSTTVNTVPITEEELINVTTTISLIEEIEIEEQAKDSETNYVNPLWLLLLVLSSAFMLSIFGIVLVFVSRTHRRFQMQTVIPVERTETIKTTNCTSSDNSSTPRRYASVSSSRRRTTPSEARIEISTPPPSQGGVPSEYDDIETVSSNNNTSRSQKKTTIVINRTPSPSEMDEDANSDLSASYQPYAIMQINAEQLSTDAVAVTPATSANQSPHSTCNNNHCDNIDTVL